MSASTSIEWTDMSWNPVRGCSVVSEGCRNCYAAKMAYRFSKPGMPYEGLTYGPRWTGKIRLVPEALDASLHWRKPRRVFVNSMSDLFHEDVPFSFIDSVFGVMGSEEAGHHAFQVLTKRPIRMNEYMQRFQRNGIDPASLFPNVWLGVSVENQLTADERIPLLLQTPAAVRFVSAEPLLGPIDLTSFGRPYCVRALSNAGEPCIHWVIVGGESGPGARPCDVAWIRSIKTQCQEASVPVFVKQLGAKPFVVEGSREAQEWSASGASAVMDDCGGIHTKDRKGGDMSEWPEDLRVREFPGVRR